MKKLFKNKKAIGIEMLLYLLIAAFALIVGVIIYLYLTKGGQGLLASIKNIFRF